MSALEDLDPHTRASHNFDAELQTIQQEAHSLCTVFADETETLRLKLSDPGLSHPERQRAVTQTRTVTLQLVNRMTGFLTKLTEMSR